MTGSAQQPKVLYAQIRIKQYDTKFSVSWPLQADQFGESIIVPSTVHTKYLGVQFHEPETLLYLPVANKLFILQLPRDGMAFGCPQQPETDVW